MREFYHNNFNKISNKISVEYIFSFMMIENVENYFRIIIFESYALFGESQSITFCTILFFSWRGREKERGQ